MKLKKQIGVTLLEILLVLAIAATIMVMFIGYVQQRTDETRRARAAIQMQQILNAGLSYYVANGNWPADIAELQTKGFLPPNPIGNPWGGAYQIKSSKPLLYVTTDVKSVPNAQVLVGRVPLGFVSDNIDDPPTQGVCTTSPLPAACTYAVGAVNIPGQNLNNATAVSFSGVYHSGACVPAPECPVDKDGNTMVPQILVIPTGVSGVNQDPIANCPDRFDYSKCTKIDVNPMSSFTANAYGDGGNPVKPVDLAVKQIRRCDDASKTAPCYRSTSSNITTGQYWRVCLSVTTDKGLVIPDATQGWVHGQAMGNILAITRCAVKNEDQGSEFQIWMH